MRNMKVLREKKFTDKSSMRLSLGYFDRIPVNLI